jgi:hypothetical protein
MDGSDDDIEEPPYSPRQLGDIVLSYYRFLATLTFNPENLRIPPESGWPELTDEHCANFKSPFALETLRHLPFWVPDDNHRDFLQVHECTSQFLNYLAFSNEDFAKFDTELYPTYLGFNTDVQSIGDEHDRTDCILLARKHSSLSPDLILDTKRGVIIEDAIDVVFHEIEEYLQELRHKFSSLQLIPSCVVGEVTLDAGYVDETTRHITEQDLVNQQGEMWGTNLDKQFVRQAYRQYGWPHQFQKEEAAVALAKVVRRVVDMRDGALSWPSLFVE